MPAAIAWSRDMIKEFEKNMMNAPFTKEPLVSTHMVHGMIPIIDKGVSSKKRALIHHYLLFLILQKILVPFHKLVKLISNVNDVIKTTGTTDIARELKGYFELCHCTHNTTKQVC